MDIEGVQEKESFPPPPTFIDTAALTGFPSPSSAYFSPQDPTIEFHHPKPKRARMGTHTSGDASPAFASPSAGSNTHDVSGRPPPASGGSHHQSAAHTRGEKRGMPPSDTSGSEGKVTRRSRPTSDPHGAGSSISSSSAKDKAPTSPPSRGSRGLHRSSVPPQNGITPILTSGSADSPHAGYSAPALHTPNQQFNSILDLFPEQKRLSLASDRPAPTSPGPSSRRQSAIAEPPRSVATNIIPPTPIAAGPPDLGKIDTSSLRNGADVVLLKIQDFGYAENDARRQYDLSIDLYDPPRPPSPAPPGFIPPMNMDEAEESEASSNFGFIGGGPHSRADEGGGWLSKDSSSNAEDLYDDQPSSQYDCDPIEFTPGLFRALYPFEPEGSAEMALEEDQEVKCLGRGGGEGWLVAVKEVTTTGEVIHALVPEAYMQLIRPLEDNEVEEAMGKR
ncbi:hypothetical protein FRC04_001312 [Tulasnella sp. 424]|nr:hypothetical protein FRC04_001312 [Tulasnella sp. 424]